MATKHKNPFRIKLEKEFGQDIITDDLWKLGMKQARQLYGFKKNVLNQKYSSVASYLIREKLKENQFKEASFFSRFEKAKGTDIERFEQAQKEEYSARISNFLDKNGEIEVSYNGQTKTLNEWYNEFNISINKDDMNNIIELTKETSEYNKKSGDYNGTSNNSNASANGVNVNNK